MIVVGVLLVILGYLLGLGIFTTIGWVLLIVGVVLLLLGVAGYPVAGRSHWF